MQNNRETKISIITGLPGSGKTTLAKKMYEKITRNGLGKECILISLDDYEGQSFQEIFDKKITYRSQSCFQFIIEGLLLTNDSIVDVLNAFINNRYTKGNVTVDIHYFNEDREACLHNDTGRREKNARITIQNAKYEIPDCNYIAKETSLSCKLHPHAVVRKSDYDVFRDVNRIVERDKLYSQSWSLGGTYGTCWDNVLHSIQPESPKPFLEFDKLLERICPNITFLQYKKLESKCVSLEQRQESDYYGGCEYRAHHVCDLRKLYNMLCEMDLLDLSKTEEEREEADR